MIQDAFPDYSGYAWYWRDIEIPAHPHSRGRYLLRFWDVDYLADVWVNGTHVGQHEGAQARFTFDVTEAVQPGVQNRIAVRVLSVFGTVDGFVRGQTPHGGYRDINVGGILDSVELLIAPPIRIEDLFVRADPKTGVIRIEAEIHNAAQTTVTGSLRFSVAPANGGESLGVVNLDRKLPSGVSQVRAEMLVAHPRLWQLNDPQLYRMNARVAADVFNSVDETSTRFGFRDFRFEHGYFRLNGQRIFWRSAHCGADTPITIRLPYDPGLLRQDLVNLKAMGFNGIRFISTMGQRHQIEMCDEIGLMVYEESYASWMLDDSPQLAARMDRSITGMILRDRNHPSVVMWGLLNETGDGAVFRHAVAALPLVRRLDDSRVVMLGSGRFDTMHFLNGLEVWKPDAGIAPCLTHNPKPYSISCVTLWRPNEIAAIPGVDGEYSVVRWTAPADGTYTVSSKFRGTGTFTTTDIHVLQAGRSVYDSFINLQGRGDECVWHETVQMLQGQPLDFAVGGAHACRRRMVRAMDQQHVAGGDGHCGRREVGRRERPISRTRRTRTDGGATAGFPPARRPMPRISDCTRSARPRSTIRRAASAIPGQITGRMCWAISTITRGCRTGSWKLRDSAGSQSTTTRCSCRSTASAAVSISLALCAITNSAE